jgi:hypothetical protein
MDLSSNTNHFDLENLRINLEYDDAYVSEFKGILKTELDMSLAILLTDLPKRNIKAINATAHRIKGAALNGCCRELGALAFRLIELVKQIESEIALVKTLIS